MKPTHIFPITLALVCLMNGCDEDSVTNAIGTRQARFPLAIGNSWTYEISRDTTLKTPDGAEATLEHVTGTVEWIIVAQDTVESMDIYKIEYVAHYSSGPDSGTSKTAYGWYVEVGDTLIGVTEQETSKIDPATCILFKPTTGATIQDKTLEPEPWGVRAIVYPLAVGNSWEFLSALGMIKTVEAFERITVTAGTFNAYRIVRDETYHITDTQTPDIIGNISLTITNWASDVGYVKTIMTTKREYTTDTDWQDTIPVPAGSSIDEVQETVLTEYHLQ